MHITSVCFEHRDSDYCRLALARYVASFANVQVEPLGLAEWAAFQDALRTLHGLDVRNLGLVGTQRMLAEVGVRSCGLDFVRCALNRVSWASAAESWQVRTVGARSYAFVRFALKGATEVRGDFVMNNTFVSSEESALFPLLTRGARGSACCVRPLASLPSGSDR